MSHRDGQVQALGNVSLTVAGDEAVVGYLALGHRFIFKGNSALQFAPAGQQSGGFQDISGRWTIVQREQKCKTIWVRAETMPALGQK